MQCEIRGMADISEAARPPPDSLPKRGRVNEVCREWLVHEDGALAYKLQKEEVEQHYTGNKSRNAVVRLDTPLAKSEQQREEDEALAMYLEQERRDAQLAQKLAERMEREDQLRRLMRERRDEEIARQLQVGHGQMANLRADRERSKLERERQERERQGAEAAYFQQQQMLQQRLPSKPSFPSPESPQPLPPRQPKPGPSSAVFNTRMYQEVAGKGAHSMAGATSLPPPAEQNYVHRASVQMQSPDVAVAQSLSPSTSASGAYCAQAHLAHTPPRAARQPHGDVNAIGLPPPPSPEDMAQHIRQMNLSRHHPAHSVCDEPPSPTDLYEEEARRIQEEKDAELARQLQEQEEREGAESVDRDRLLAMEAQDQELARMLQDKERAKLKRARERAKQKALLKKQQEQQGQGTPGPSGVNGEPQHQRHPSADDEDGCYSLPHQESPVPSGSVGVCGAESPPLRYSSRPSDLDLSNSASKHVPSKSRRRFPDPEAIEEIPQTNTSNGSTPVSGSNINESVRNIATVIDPTYPRRSPATTSEVSSTAAASPCQSEYIEDQGSNPVPPYMPIQGQRRTASLEKKAKKKSTKDGCKHQ